MGSRNKFGMTLRGLNNDDKNVILNLFQDLPADLFNSRKTINVCSLKVTF
jgi:hypothetical protein